MTTHERTAADRTAINALISARILAAEADGLDLADAVDRVLGAGTFAKVAGDLYDALRTQAGAR